MTGFAQRYTVCERYPDSSIVRKTACHGTILGFVMGHDLRRLFVSRLPRRPDRPGAGWMGGASTVAARQCAGAFGFPAGIVKRSPGPSAADTTVTKPPTGPKKLTTRPPARPCAALRLTRSGHFAPRTGSTYRLNLKQLRSENKSTTPSSACHAPDSLVAQGPGCMLSFEVP